MPFGCKKVSPDKSENSYLLTNGAEHILSEELLCGMVYISETKCEVYQYTGQLIPKYGNFEREVRSGMFFLGKGIDWNARTPRQEYDQLHEIGKKALKNQLNSLAPYCICHFPRVLDFVTTRNGTDKDVLLKSISLLWDLKQSKSLRYKPEVFIYECKTCGSRFREEYEERGRDELFIEELKIHDPVGLPALTTAPSYFEASFIRLFQRKSYLLRDNLYSSDLKEWLDYLFARKPEYASSAM